MGFVYFYYLGVCEKCSFLGFILGRSIVCIGDLCLFYKVLGQREYIGKLRGQGDFDQIQERSCGMFWLGG